MRFGFLKILFPQLEKNEYSPVLRHIGLYGYRWDVLQNIAKLEDGYYEEFEGLEQLRWIENGIKVRCVKVDYKDMDKLAALSGVDTQQDIERVEEVLNLYGEF